MKCLISVFCVLMVGVGVAGQGLPDGTTATQISAPSFTLGDQYFGIAAGGYFPLFLINPNDGTNSSTNQNIGGQLALEWNVYLNSLFSIGIETGYIFASTPNEELLSLWPIALQFGFAPQLGRFFIPVHLDVGVMFNYYENRTQPALLLRGGLGFYWFFNPDWGIGVDFDYYFAPLLFAGPTPPPSDNRVLNSLVGSVGVVYRL